MVERTTWLINKLTPALDMDGKQREDYLRHLGRTIKTAVALSGQSRLLDNYRDLCAAGLATEKSPNIRIVWEILLDELGEEEVIH